MTHNPHKPSQGGAMMADRLAGIDYREKVPDPPNPSNVKTTPAYEAMHAYDGANNVEPARTVAERIGWKYGCDLKHPLVDEIAHAIEDGWRWGAGRQRAYDIEECAKVADKYAALSNIASKIGRDIRALALPASQSSSPEQK